MVGEIHFWDWIVLSTTLLFIVIYGVYKTRKTDRGVQDYIKGGNDTKWWTIGLSVMATQASAITFLSTPGQAFHDGMGFVQFYFWIAHSHGDYLHGVYPHVLQTECLYCIRIFRNSF